MADRDPDFEAADREARRIVDEYPRLIQPCDTAHNLARAYLELRRGWCRVCGTGLVEAARKEVGDG